MRWMQTTDPNCDEEWTELVDLIDERSVAAVEGAFRQIGVDPRTYRCECREMMTATPRSYWRLSSHRDLKQQLRDALAKICNAR